MNRREFIRWSSMAIGAGAVPGGLQEVASALTGSSTSTDRFLRHRFGVNYVPSRNWYYCWNDWHASDIRRDLDAIAEVGADHIRIMLVWPWFQPNPKVVSEAHLDRLEELLGAAAERKLDVLITLYTGWLSGYRLVPPYLEKEPFYSSPLWGSVQKLYLEEVSKRAMRHDNFLGFDIGNEINDCWATDPATGDRWLKSVLGQMRKVCPDRVHVNGVDQRPWFEVETFSPQTLMAEQEIVTLHCWPYWTGAGKHGGPLDKPYTMLPAAMAALARSYGGDAKKPIWLEEFGACKAEMPEADVPRWMEKAVTGAVSEGISWFTWWASHDVDRRFEFNEFEYTLGLMTTDNQMKEQGRMFRRLADTYRGKPVVLPTKALPAPPRERTSEATWRWMLEWMGVSGSKALKG